VPSKSHHCHLRGDLLETVTELRRFHELAADKEDQQEAAAATVDVLTGRPKAIELLDARCIDTFEHPTYFQLARRQARTRMLVTSPWVKRSVVTKQFQEELTACAQRGTLVHIGYGFNENADGCDEDAVHYLQQLHERYANVVVAMLGATHAKILIWDDAQIVSSFNWLSFRGDADKTYRQEIGTYMRRVATVTDDLWTSQREMIEKVAGKQAHKNRG
jgi:hypothetical protein